MIPREQSVSKALFEEAGTCESVTVARLILELHGSIENFASSNISILLQSEDRIAKELVAIPIDDTGSEPTGPTEVGVFSTRSPNWARRFRRACFDSSENGRSVEWAMDSHKSCVFVTCDK